jgi:hypothetical protein
VPIWWRPANSFDAKVLPDGNLTWFTATSGGTNIPGYEVRRPDGSLVRTWRTVGVETDIHDMQLLSNGNALLLSYVPRPGNVDLSSFGVDHPNETVVDSEIQEVTPSGTLVKSWNTKDHIPPTETGTRWWNPGVMGFDDLPDGRRAYDYAHINSIQLHAGVVVASFRHFDADYGINWANGSIFWKLGGTQRPESLRILDDAQGDYPFGGPHYARVQPDGSISLYDNNTFLPAAPRVVRYRLDLFAKTARLLDEVTDSEVTTSFCCGSAERLADGSYVTSWGGQPVVTEVGPTGTRRFKLTFSGGFSYRVAVPGPNSPSVQALRVGMDAQAN